MKRRHSNPFVTPPRTPKKAKYKHTYSGKVSFKDRSIGVKVEREELKRDDANHPDNILSSQFPSRTVKIAKKHRPSRKVKKAIAFRKKVSKAIEFPVPFNVWAERGNSDTLTPLWRDTIVNHSLSTNGSFAFVSHSHSQYMINPGENWVTTSELIDPYPNGPMNRMQSDSALQVEADTVQSGIRTTHARAVYQLFNSTNLTVIFDIYTFVAAQDISDGRFRDVPYSLFNLTLDTVPFNNASYITKYGVQGTATSPENVYREFTPLDVQNLGKWWRLETKVTHECGPSAIITFNFPNIRKFVGKPKDIEDKFAIKGRTQCMYIVAKPFSATIASGAEVARIIGTKTFHYKEIGRVSSIGSQVNRPFSTTIGV